MTANAISSRSRIASFCLSFALTAPGFYVGLLGITDMAPSSPTGISGVAELFGFGFWVWAVFSSIRALIKRFLGDVFGQPGSLFAAIVIAYGFWLLMTVIGFEATLEHKKAFTWALQPLGCMAGALMILKLSRRALQSWSRHADSSKARLP